MSLSNFDLHLWDPVVRNPNERRFQSSLVEDTPSIIVLKQGITLN